MNNKEKKESELCIICVTKFFKICDEFKDTIRNEIDFPASEEEQDEIVNKMFHSVFLTTLAREISSYYEEAQKILVDFTCKRLATLVNECNEIEGRNENNT